MKKVGVSFLDEKRDRKFSYKNILYDENGWADAKKYIPEDFDLVSLKVKDKEPIFYGWSIGKNWDGYKIQREDEVIAWKRQE